MDAYHGIIVLNLETKVVRHLVKPTDSIYTFHSTVIDPAVLATPRFYNDLDFLSDNSGDFVFTDSSYKWTRSENRQEILDGAPRGRLFYYQAAARQVYIALCGLHFPNGVQRYEGNKGNEEFLVADLTRFRILKINLSYLLKHNLDLLRSCKEDNLLETFLQAYDYNQHGVTVFADSHPGLADNIRLDRYQLTQKPVEEEEVETIVETHESGSIIKRKKKKTKQENAIYWVGTGSVSKRPFSLLWIGYQSIVLRNFIGKFVPMRWVEKLVPPYGLIVGYNYKGEIVATMHDPTGEVISMISHAERHPLTGDLWIGSHSESYIGILPNEYMFMKFKSNHVYPIRTFVQYFQQVFNLV